MSFPILPDESAVKNVVSWQENYGYMIPIKKKSEDQVLLPISKDARANQLINNFRKLNRFINNKTT
ncbi:hypothetical protein LCGC14_2716260 [marine sediment metagenome]|uniref:Uncharacterized protein n=1 Tax=marine sediment metagenome TaxID=412755 RepID=A0A0F8ZBC5_9ZZZZ|nr:hypothetical protein [Desulfobacterales bacterium]